MKEAAGKRRARCELNCQTAGTGLAHHSTNHCLVTLSVSNKRQLMGSFSFADAQINFRVQELCESRGGRPGLSVLMNLMVSVDVKQH